MKHIPATSNILADRLYHLQVAEFHHRFQAADHLATIPSSEI